MRSIRESSERPRRSTANAASTRVVVSRRVVAATFAAAACAACSSGLPAPLPTGGTAAQAEPRRGGILELATFADVRAVDPANVADGVAPGILQALFAGLVDYDLEGHLVPDLAETYAVEDGGKLLRFRLRQGVLFHDGEELTADDVKRSVERALHPTAPNPYSTFFEAIAGYADYVAGKSEHLPGVVVEGRYLVSFRLDQPDAVFLPALTMHALRPVCRSAGVRYSDTWHPCGAGPFKLEVGAWQRARELLVVRHPGYFRPGRPYLDGVRWSFHEKQTSQRFKFTTGALDVVREFLTPDLLRFQSDPRWKPFGEFEAEQDIAGESMNTEMPPFDNVEIRRAVAAAIDREQIRLVRAANLHAIDGPVPPSVFGYAPEVKKQRYDLAEALEHMRRAGYPYDPATRTGGWPRPIPYLAYATSLPEFTAQVLAQQLERIGLRFEIRVVNYPTFMALRGRRRTSPIGQATWKQDYPDALSFLEPLFHSKSINDEDSNNTSFYKNPRLDEILDRAKREMDDARRKTLYADAQQLLCDEAPWAFTHSYRVYVQRQPYVKSYRPHPMWTFDFTQTWLDRGAGSRLAHAILGEGGALASLIGARRPAR